SAVSQRRGSGEDQTVGGRNGGKFALDSRPSMRVDRGTVVAYLTATVWPAGTIDGGTLRHCNMQFAGGWQPVALP
ncbi:MAG TPA: hypothetical protein VIM38_12295, partial [Alphaproteobacteria bacterium]